MPILAALAQLVPSVIGLFNSDDKSTSDKAGSLLAAAATAVSGKPTPEEALDVLRGDPKLLARFRANVERQSVDIYRSETDRLVQVNKTIRTEATSKHAFVRNWRPYIGYVVGTALGIQLIGLTIMPFVIPNSLGQVAQVLTASLPLWAVACTLLGVAAAKRSNDKLAAAGMSPVSGLAAVVKAFKGGK